MVAETRRTLCNRDCPDACAILAEVDVDVPGGRVTALRGDPDHPVTRGFLCYRTSHFLGRQYDPARITRPLLRGPDGELHPGSWDEALDYIAERLSAIMAESGPAAIFHYHSGGTLGLLGKVVDYFWEQVGPVTIKRGDICSGAGEAAQIADFGESDSNDVFDLKNARHIILWGKNPHTSGPHLVPILRECGAEKVLVDPVHHKAAGICDVFVQPRPAGDLALALAVARVLFARGWVHPDAASWCDGLDGFRALAESRTLEAWCAEADVDEAQVVDLARRLHDGPTTILVGWGMARRANGGTIVRALDALVAITGNIGVPGAGASYYFKRRAAFDTSFLRGEEAAPRTLPEPLFGRAVLDAADPPVRAVWITAGNPVAMLPDSHVVAEALRTRELVVVADSWLSDTAALAHVVLPTPTLLEADDLLGAYGHHWIGAATPVVEPLGEARSDLDIVQALAQRMGLGEVMAGSARDWKRRIAKGFDLDALEAGAVRNPGAAKVLFEGRRFATETGRAQLVTALPEASPAIDGDPDRPLFLLSLSTPRSQSSQWSGPPLEGPAELTVHPDAAPGFADGAEARVESVRGSLAVRLRFDGRQRRDVAVIPKGGELRHGRCANALVRAALTDIGEGGALYDERVRILPP